MNSTKLKYCNWSFDELIMKNKWLVRRDCRDDTSIELSRGDSRNWKAYQSSLQPRYQGQPPLVSSKCPNCNRYVNGVNPYDDGQTWRVPNEQ